MRARDRMDPEIAAGLALLPPELLTLDDIPSTRAASDALVARLHALLPPNERIRVREHPVPVPSDLRHIRLRAYRPAGQKEPEGPALPVLFWIHGGGLVMGGLDADDALLASFVETVECVCVSVEYRLAPEAPFPAAVEDCYAGLLWTATHAEELGIDPDRLAIGGVSAGAGLAAAAALMARDRGGPTPAFQLLVQPMLDDRLGTASSRQFTDLDLWNLDAARAAWAAALGDAAGTSLVPPYAAPARAPDLSGLPPAYVEAAELDVFRDEGVHYALRLLRAGVAVELHVYPGVCHAFDYVAPGAAVSARALRDRMSAVHRALQG